MPRARDVIIPNAVPGIEEVVVTHTRTAMGGTRTKEKIVPVILPSPPAAASSKSKKASRNKLHQITQASERAIPTQRPTECTDEHEYLDEQEYGGPDQALQDSPPQPTTPMEQWIHLHSGYLHILLDNEGRPSSNKCLSLGLALCLGHGGTPCPKTVEGIKAAHASNSHPKARARSTSLQYVLEELPGELEISDMNMDANDTGTGWTCTAVSGNSLFTVVDWGGVFDMEVIFCICSHGGDKDAQLLRSELFPAMFKQIETLFTFSVLEDFVTDNLECKTTTQQYYSKLQIMTNRMFPNNVPNQYKQLLRVSWQWWDLKNRMESGGSHLKKGEAMSNGAMAIFCPACPQLGINLPDEWKATYTPLRDELIWTFIMDGNFSAEHMRHQSGERDISLSAGMAFMANPEVYKAHLWSGQETSQPSTCNTYRAIEQANTSCAHLDVTGIGATVCCHGFFVPTSVVDFQKGERQINMDYSICKALSFNMKDIPVALVMYDVMCQYWVHFQKRVKNSPELSIPSSLELGWYWAVPYPRAPRFLST
ncbi:hypothetical protein EI94DRAFT_1703402 [Lactarius quietus]|nr:hypothetical protein EI94DRAFT_1703402 [Lactarius quietus]